MTSEQLTKALEMMRAKSNNPDPVKAQVEEIQVRQYIAGKYFPAFCLYYFPTYFKRPSAPFHYEIMNGLQDLQDFKISELLIVGFRGCAKTTLMQLWLLWIIVFKKRKYVNVDSYDGENAQRTLFEISQILLTNKRLIADYGILYNTDRTKSNKTQNRIDNFTTANGIRVESNTTNVDVRGRKHFEQRPDVRVLDDFENEVTKDSVAKTESIKKNITSSMNGMSERGIMLYLGNYITDKGNVQKLIDRSKIDPTLRVINVPILKDGQPTWASRYCLTDEEAQLTGKESIETIQRKNGSYVFSYEFMNIPVDEAMSEFKKDFRQFVTDFDVARENTLTYITIDSAVKETETADFTGVTINKVSENNKWYIRTYREKMNSMKLIDHIFELWEREKPEFIGIEETNFVTAIKPFIDEKMRAKNKFINFRLLSHKKTNKVARIRGLIPRWESKSIFLVGDNTYLIEEMKAFPNGSHDDVLDSLAYQIGICPPPVPVYGFRNQVSQPKPPNKAR